MFISEGDGCFPEDLSNWPGCESHLSSIRTKMA